MYAIVFLLIVYFEENVENIACPRKQWYKEKVKLLREIQVLKICKL